MGGTTGSCCNRDGCDGQAEDGQVVSGFRVQALMTTITTRKHPRAKRDQYTEKVPHNSRQERGGRGRPRAQKQTRDVQGWGVCEGGRARRGLKVDEGRGFNGDELDG